MSKTKETFLWSIILVLMVLTIVNTSKIKKLEEKPCKELHYDSADLEILRIRKQNYLSGDMETTDDHLKRLYPDEFKTDSN